MLSATSRRGFLSGTAAAVAAASLPLNSSATPASVKPSPILLGVASYSFYKLDRQHVIDGMKALKTPYLNVKDVHLPMTTPEEIRKAAAEYRAAGLTLTGAGTISLQKDDDAEMRKAFEYCKQAGIPLIVAAPTLATLPRVEKFAKEYDIRIAIHNHGPEDKHFPSPLDVLKAVRNMDPHMGLCMDVGHAVRTGTDVVAAIKAAGPRLFDMHIKDLANLKDRESQVPVGDGELPIVGIFQALIGIKFKGHVMLEYEIDSTNPLPGMIKSFAYMRGALAGMGYRA
ncbi:MAG: sugar phosphate isomerase/epimerase [Bryobacteraceae bacterium]|nr:sugar phosphate isomerase/epimerase [Bryobacteraceae bacterium]